MELLETGRTKEEYAVDGVVPAIELPLASDVLLSKGKPIQEHTGNLRLHAIGEECYNRYHSSHKLEKTALTTGVVFAVKRASGRFRSKESGVWIEVDNAVAREKVSNLFRSRRKCAPKTDMCIAARPGCVRNNGEISMLHDVRGNKGTHF
jgi:hypothetical protein